MKFLAFTAVASALVIPESRVVFKELIVDVGSYSDVSISQLSKAVQTTIYNGLDAVDSWLPEGLAQAEAALLHDDEMPASESEFEHDLTFCETSEDCPPFFADGKHKLTNYTVYQLLTGNNYTTKFAALVKQYDELVDLLNSTTVNTTLFVPTDAAFEKLPGGEINATGAALEAIVRYHIGLGAFPYKIIYKTHTIPTAHKEALLDDEPQRLRTRFEKGGLRLNFYSHIVAPNFIAKNGVLHAVDTIATPPTFVGAQLARLPFRYSTLMLAMQKTNFTKYIHALPLRGTTVFAASNAAFDQLSPKLNAFLFNTPRGLKYLDALLKYSIVPNVTVYSDAYYGPELPPQPEEPEVVESSKKKPVERTHYELPTLLGNATVSLNVTTFPGHVFMTVNKGVRVAIQDGVAKNGVFHEVNRLVFPPLLTPPEGSDDDDKTGYPWEDNVWTVADAIARLRPYVDDEVEGGDESGEPEVSEL